MGDTNILDPFQRRDAIFEQYVAEQKARLEKKRRKERERKDHKTKRHRDGSDAPSKELKDGDTAREGQDTKRRRTSEVEAEDKQDVLSTLDSRQIDKGKGVDRGDHGERRTAKGKEVDRGGSPSSPLPRRIKPERSRLESPPLDSKKLGTPSKATAKLEHEVVGAAESGPTGGNRTVVVLDDSGDEEEETRGDPQRLSGREASTVDLDDGDPFDDVADKAGGAGKDEAEDEFQEYVRQAEARLRRTESASQSKEEQKVTDGAVVIYITSRIPGTANLRVKRGLKQHLGAARDAFCQYQRLKHVPGFPKENDEAIFLTWKGNRIYNSTTCVGLGICLDDEGRLRTSTKTRSGTTETGFIGGRSLADGADQLHFEAWTEETYQAYLEEKERERLRASGELPFDYGVNDDDASGKGRTQGSADEPVEAAPVRKFRVFLVAKGQDPVRVSATPQTTIAELVAQYRRKAGLAADASVSLQFDGDTLDPANTLEAADISEDDKIDVYVS